MYRTHTCGQLNKEDTGKEVVLSGWVHRRRDHGGLIFIDLRDRYGLTQITFDPDSSKEALDIADHIRSEYVIKVTGKVVARPEGMVNAKMSTGEIEIEAKEVEILSKSKTPPFEIEKEGEGVNEEIRLKYRYLDLRHDRMQKNIAYRAKVTQFIRKWMTEKDFVEIETPILTASSPEGARDFLVPSRLHKGKFYALPQAPQQYKQLLMVAGFDKYFQIAPCFRDEDARADRSPGEFYQLDLETSFLTQEEFFNLIEPLFIEITEKLSDKKILQKPFPRIPFKEAMLKYGTDKPDIRFGLEIRDLSDIIKDCEFSVFSGAVKDGGIVRAINAKGAAKFTRKDIDGLTEFVKGYGAKGLAYIIIEQGGSLKSPIVKFLGDDLAREIVEKMEGGERDIIFFGADKEKIVCDSLGSLRNELAKKLDLMDNGVLGWCWIVDFPMFEYDEKEDKIDFSHNPFSMPQGEMEALETKDPLDILAYQYDIVCNGIELSSGAVRNYKPEIMYKAFEIAGYDRKVVDDKFGHMISAFQYGAPPHCGIAPGIERLIMVLKDEPSIREVVAFPKNGQAQDLVVDAPGEVSEEQLKELGICIRSN